MKLSEEQKQMFVNCGAFGYDAAKMSSITDISEIEIFKAMQDSQSEISKLYQKGLDKADFAIDTKLFELARKGDIKALNKLEQRKRIRTLR